MSFLKSYYESVSSYLVGEDAEEKSKKDCTEEKEIVKSDEMEQELSSEGWLGAYNTTGIWKAVKTDLTEFASVLSKDAKSVVMKTASGVKYGLKSLDGTSNEINEETTDENSKTEPDTGTGYITSTINKVLDQVSKAFYIPPDSDDEFSADTDTNGMRGMSARVQSRIDCLQRNRETFVVDPDDVTDKDVTLGEFSTWKNNLNFDDFQSTIKQLITSNQSLYDYYAELVPRVVTHEEFWSRYFYRVAVIKAEETRRELLKIKIEVEANEDELEDDWDDAPQDEGNNEIETPLNDTIKQDSNSEQKFSDLQIKEKDDLIFVKHSGESSQSSQENSIEISSKTDCQKAGDDDCGGWDDGEDGELDVVESGEMKKQMSKKEDVGDTWDDWN